LGKASKIPIKITLKNNKIKVKKITKVTKTKIIKIANKNNNKKSGVSTSK